MGNMHVSSKIICSLKPYNMKEKTVTINSVAGAVVRSVIRASVNALCRDGAGQISRERVQFGRLTPQRTAS